MPAINVSSRSLKQTWRADQQQQQQPAQPQQSNNIKHLQRRNGMKLRFVSNVIRDENKFTYYNHNNNNNHHIVWEERIKWERKNENNNNNNKNIITRYKQTNKVQNRKSNGVNFLKTFLWVKTLKKLWVWAATPTATSWRILLRPLQHFNSLPVTVILSSSFSPPSHSLSFCLSSSTAYAIVSEAHREVTT